MISTASATKQINHHPLATYHAISKHTMPFQTHRSTNASNTATSYQSNWRATKAPNDNCPLKASQNRWRPTTQSADFRKIHWWTSCAPQIPLPPDANLKAAQLLLYLLLQALLAVLQVGVVLGFRKAHFFRYLFLTQGGVLTVHRSVLFRPTTVSLLLYFFIVARFAVPKVSIHLKWRQAWFFQCLVLTGGAVFTVCVPLHSHMRMA